VLLRVKGKFSLLTVSQLLQALPEFNLPEEVRMELLKREQGL